MRRLLPFLILLMAGWFAAQRRASRSESAAPLPQATAPQAPPSVTSPEFGPPTPGSSGGGLAPRVRIGQPDVGFRSDAKLDEHYAKHGAEFGNITKAEYLRLAQQLRDSDPGGPILEIVRPADGVVSRFDTRTGAFLANDRDGTIRTFFKPNDGEAYFRRQAKRRPNE